MSDQQIPTAGPGGSMYPQPPAPKKKSHKALIITLSCVAAFLVLVCAVGAAFVHGVGDALDDAGKPNAVASHSAAPAAGDDSSTPDDAATDEPEPRPTGSDALKIGDSLDLSQDDGLGGDSSTGTVTVTKVDRSTGPVIEYGEGPQNGTFVVFTVKVKCTAGRFDFNPDDFYIRDAAGTRYELGGGNAYEATSSDPMNYTDLNAGEHVQGPLPYDVKSAHGVLVYDPNMSGEPLAEWSF